MWTHHSHSGQFCRHAKGKLVEVVQKADQLGFQCFGLSEHMPRFRHQDLYPEESDLNCKDLSDIFDQYIIEATKIKKEYAGRINILVGLETDWICSDSASHLDQVLTKYKDSLDYIVGSVHHVNGVPIDFDRATFDKCLHDTCQGDLSTLFSAYFDAQYELMTSFRPEVIGHFDLCRLYLPDTDFRKDPIVWAKIRRNIDYAVSYGALFEINAAAFRKGWKTGYPGRDLLHLIRESNGRLCLSDDSHGPDAVALHYKDAFKYLKAEGVENLYYLECAETGKADSQGRARTKVRQVEDDWQRMPFFASLQD